MDLEAFGSILLVVIVLKSRAPCTAAITERPIPSLADEKILAQLSFVGGAGEGIPPNCAASLRNSETNGSL